MRCPAQGAAGGWVMPGLVITWLLSEVYDKNKNVTEGKKKKA